MPPSPHPALQLRGKLGLKLAGGSFTVVSLDEHFVSQRCAVPQLLQIVKLRSIKHTPINQMRFWYSYVFIMSPQRELHVSVQPFTCNVYKQWLNYKYRMIDETQTRYDRSFCGSFISALSSVGAEPNIGHTIFPTHIHRRVELAGDNTTFHHRLIRWNKMRQTDKTAPKL